MSKKTVIAKIRVIAGKEYEYLSLVAPLVEASRKEPGNLVYSLYRDVRDRSEFMAYEEWADENAFNEHCRTELFRSFGEQVQPLLAGEIDIQVYG